ncbi:MAG: hypothetical protein KY468_09400 [Armatimonadetes bacterium]|nr:hypothetical protein [Armatimonadota bacterium]
MAQDSGKVGAQNRGAGVNAGREAEHRVRDNVDAGSDRKMGLQHTNAVTDEESKANIDRVEQERPLTGVAKQTGGLEKNNDSRDPGPDLSSVQGVQTGGAAAQDSPVQDPSLVSTAQSSKQD